MLKKKEYIKSVKRPYPPLFCSLVCMGYPNRKYYKGIVKEPFSINNMAHVDNVWYYGKADLERGGQLALASWRDQKLFNYVKEEFKRREANLVSSAEKSFKDFCGAYQEYMPALALVFVIDKPAEAALKNALLKKLSAEEVIGLMNRLNIPLQDNFYKQEEYDLVMSTNLKEHVKKYRWLNARYGDVKEYTLKEAHAKLKDIDKDKFLEKWKKDKEELISAITYTKQLLRNEDILVDIFQYIIYYRTQRTDILNMSAFLAIPMLKKKAKSLGLTYEQLLRCSTKEILEDQIPIKEILESRMKDCSTLLEDGRRVSLLTGGESEKIIDFFKEEVKEIRELKGSIACGGLIKGIVRIISNKNDFSKVGERDILVTSMTTPEMVPIMKKASAFVTDEGGITCHAAIVAREMKKPCIIGTKIATQVLKDGDLVEVDANKGIIKVIK